MSIDLQTLVSLGSLLGVSIAVYRIYKMKEAAMKAEGIQQQRQTTLESDLLLAKAKITDLEARLRTTDCGVASIQTDIKHIVSALSRIEQKLDTHIASDPKEA